MQTLIMCDISHYSRVKYTLDLFSPVFLWSNRDLHYVRTGDGVVVNIVGNPQIDNQTRRTLNYYESTGDIRIVHHKLDDILMTDRTLAQSNFYNRLNEE